MDTQISNLYLPDSDKDEEIKKRVLTVLVDKEISGEGHEQIDIQISNLHLPDSDRDQRTCSYSSNVFARTFSEFFPVVSDILSRLELLESA